MGKKKSDNNLVMSEIVKLVIPAGKATPTPPIGPVLGARKVNIGAFCSNFNELTKNIEVGCPVNTKIHINRGPKGSEFTIELAGIPTSYLIKKAAGISKGSNAPGRNNIGKITKEQLELIAKEKFSFLNSFEINEAMKIVAGTAASMGIEIEGNI